MPITDAFIIAAIVAAFAVFGAVLALGGIPHQALAPAGSKHAVDKQLRVTTIHAKAA
jgi:multisubunit Na+/H+ antiporter MnhC subunit